MEIENIHIYNLKIPFSRTVKHNLYSRRESQSLIIVLQDHNGKESFGEGTPREYVTGERLRNSLMCAKALSKKIVGQKIGSTDELHALLKDLGETDLAIKNPAAFCAIETALLALWSKIEHKTLYQLFTHKNITRRLSYSGVIPYIRSEDTLLEYIALFKKLELTSLKVKVIDIDSGMSQLKIIRGKLGSDIDIRVDANSAFTVDTAIAFIKRAKSIHLSAIEQPVIKDDLIGLKKISESSEIPILADESMYTPRGPFYLIDNNICHGLNIRLSSCGGFRKAYHIYRQAALKKMTIVIGAHVGETAILSFAGRNLAMMCREAKYMEGSFSTYVLKEDLVDQDISFAARGVVPVPTDFGLGIEIESSTIEKWSERYATISTSHRGS